ncbi:hypothetical protein JOD97_000089 [Duganella sp. 1411]|nr:hypothetical protein [Duganella sp. 1411]
MTTGSASQNQAGGRRLPAPVARQIHHATVEIPGHG